MAANFYVHMYHETDEARECREQYNLRETGEKSATSEAMPTLIELPTAAGSVSLDLNKQQGSSGPSSLSPTKSTLRARDQFGKVLARNSSGLKKEKTKRTRKSEEHDESELPTGGAEKRSSQDKPTLFSKGGHEDDIPPLTAEVCVPAHPSPSARWHCVRL